MRNILHRFVIYLLCMFLYACATGELKQDVSITTKTSISYVDVDSDVETDFDSAVDLMQQGKYAQAVEILKTVIEREQRLPAPYVNIAMAYSQLGDTKQAEKNLVTALKLDFGHAVANNELGMLYRKAGKFNAARTAYENAIKQNPDYLPVKRNLGVLCDLYLHDYECALTQFKDYLELDPEDKTVAIWVADVKLRLGVK